MTKSFPQSFTRRILGLGFLTAALIAGAAAPSFGETPKWTQVMGEGAPAARHESAAAALDGRIYIIGGRGERPLDIYDTRTGKWTKGAQPPSEMNHVQAITHGGKIYIIGALKGPFPEEQIVSHVQVYDPSTDQWSQGAEIPAARRRGGAGVVVHNGLIYLVGGNARGHNSGFVAWTDSFNPATGEWKVLADAPRPRDHFHAAVLNGKIYAAGGRRSAFDAGKPMELTIAETDVYDIATNSWTTAAAPLPTPRAGSSAIVRGGKIVVIGGESGSQVAGHAEVEAFDPKTGAWTAFPPLPVGRHGFQAVDIKGVINVIAGSGNRGGGPELTDHWALNK